MSKMQQVFRRGYGFPKAEYRILIMFVAGVAIAWTDQIMKTAIN